ncbi:alpha/beta hydrolase [Mycolicibacterium sp. XJ662]
MVDSDQPDRARARLIDRTPPLAVQRDSALADESIAESPEATGESVAPEVGLTVSTADALDRLGVLDRLTAPEAGNAGVTSSTDEFKPTPVDAIRTVVDEITARGRALLTHLVERSEGTPLAYPLVSAAAIASQFSQPLGGNVVNVIGSLLFNIIGAAMHLISGPAIVPPGSSVSVRTSTLTLPNSGQTVRADWYFPDEVDDSTRLIYLQHGFMATGPMYSYTAAHLAERTNSIVVAPTLSSNPFDAHGNWLGGAQLQQSVADLFVGDRAELTESASAAARHQVTLPDSFVMVGHSLGGAFVSGAAAATVNNGAIDNLKGVVLLDGVDVADTMPRALDKLSGDNYRPVYDVSSERYVWSLHGVTGDALEKARPGEFNGVMLVGGRHIDAARGGNPLLQIAEYVITGFSQPQNTAAAEVLTAGWINDMFDGTQDSGIYGDPGEMLHIPTRAGTATAVVLPFPSPDSVVAMPWDGISELILKVIFGLAGYDLPARSTPAEMTV